MKIHQIILRCQKDRDHAKVIRLNNNVPDGYVETLAELLDGSSHHFIYPPGEKSPIGKCATCGGELKSEISEVMTKNNVARDFRGRERVIESEKEFI